MSKIFDKPFIRAFFYAETNLMEEYWIAEGTSQMTAQDFKAYQHEKMQLLEEKRPDKLLVDTRGFFFAISPELQTWVNENVTNRQAQAGLKKIAFVASEDFISQISIEQTMEEFQGASMKIGFFETIEAARNWLR